MLNTRTLVLVTLGLVLSTHSVQTQSPPGYRGFQLGSDLLSISTLANVAAGEARTLHLRPAVIQELGWRAPYLTSGSGAPPADPVQQIGFSFYNDQLFKIVINYDRYRTDGLTNADVIEALSDTYGSLSKPAVKPRAAVSQFEAEFGTPLAQWGDVGYSVELYRSSYVQTFRVIVTSLELEALARTAVAQAIKLDEREAPQREIARLQKEAEENRATQEKARVSNKAAFRP
ncbi:MAG TPA: hypothetical protein VM818_24325 [Vicinamibacterales bacterium]|jgi:hypothetical protein|nr:hypothetical protein [Vicinamibacterales bacterium]